MIRLVVDGAQLRCSQGAAPSSLTVLPGGLADGDGKPMATVMDHRPTANIAPFGMCRSQANPQVIAATSAAMGTLTPQPCVPVIPAPWSSGSSLVTIGEHAALTAGSSCRCTWNGMIEVTDAGTALVEADE